MSLVSDPQWYRCFIFEAVGHPAQQTLAQAKTAKSVHTIRLLGAMLPRFVPAPIDGRQIPSGFLADFMWELYLSGWSNWLR
jgi:hypothetical protein